MLFLSLQEEKKAIRFLNDGGCLIINVVRDPFSRAISSVIQNYYLYHSDSDFVAAVIKNAESISLDWWDSEFKKNMDWDIYDYDFDREKGYSIYDLRNNNRLLVLKQETLRSNGEKIISQFVKENIQLRRVNTSEKKKVKLKFNETIKNLRYPKENINNILSSKFINHFYTDQEKLKLQKKWEKNLRIAYFHYGIFEGGDNNGWKRTYNLAKGLSEIGHEVVLFTTLDSKNRENISKNLNSSCLEVKAFRDFVPNKLRTGGFSFFAAFLKVIFLIKNKPFDICICDNVHRPACLIPAIYLRYFQKFML